MSINGTFLGLIALVMAMTMLVGQVQQPEQPAPAKPSSHEPVSATALPAVSSEDSPREIVPAAARNDQTPDLKRVSELIIEQTNSFRMENRLKAVSRSTELSDAARYFANYMAQTDKYGHTADGSEPWERAEKHRYAYCTVEENIAFEMSSGGFTTEELAKAFVTGWEQSPGHRKNMLNPSIVDTGVSVAHSSKTDRYYAVQMFGRPRSMQISFTISNASDVSADYTLDGKTRTVAPNEIVTHKVCTDPNLFLQPVDASGKPLKDKQLLHPHDGSRYTVVKGIDGVVRVEEH